MFDVDIRGLDELLAQLAEFERALEEETAEGFGRAAVRVAEDTAADTPVKTGRAQAGLKGIGGEVRAPALRRASFPPAHHLPTLPRTSVTFLSTTPRRRCWKKPPRQWTGR